MSAPSSPNHIYLRSFDPAGQSSLAIIARRISQGAAVLDLGTGPGVLGQYLAKSKACVVDGVECHPQQAEMAAPAYRKLQTADLEQIRLAELFPEERYDFIVCADLLEHLRDPGQILDQLPALLKPTGRILLSVPNVAYVGLIADLLAGDFQYRPEGLLDSTHLHFFTRKSLLAFLGEHHLIIANLDAVPLAMQHSEFSSRHPDTLPPAVCRYLFALPDALTYQFIVEATPHADGLTEAIPPPAEQPEPEPSFCSQLFWKTLGGEYDQNNAVATLARIGKSFQTITFPIPALSRPLAGLRLDPADRAGYLTFHGIRLFNHLDDCLWAWNGDIKALESRHTQQMAFASAWQGGSGVVALLAGDDPFLELPIPTETLSTLQSGGRLEVEISWPMSSDYLALAPQLLNPDAKLQRVKELETEKLALQEKLALLQEQNNGLLETKALLEAELAALRQSIAAIQASKSWRYSRPLARLWRWLRGA